jgi:hypothetical protein
MSPVQRPTATDVKTVRGGSPGEAVAVLPAVGRHGVEARGALGSHSPASAAERHQRPSSRSGKGEEDAAKERAKPVAPAEPQQVIPWNYMLTPSLTAAPGPLLRQDPERSPRPDRPGLVGARAGCESVAGAGRFLSGGRASAAVKWSERRRLRRRAVTGREWTPSLLPGSPRDGRAEAGPGARERP